MRPSEGVNRMGLSGMLPVLLLVTMLVAGCSQKREPGEPAPETPRPPAPVKAWTFRWDTRTDRDGKPPGIYASWTAPTA